MTDTKPRRPRGRPIARPRLPTSDAPYAPPDQSHHMPSQDHGEQPMTASLGMRFNLSPCPRSPSAAQGTRSL